MIQATLDPDIPESHVPAGLITWTGGSPVESHPLQRKLSKATSAHTTVTATCCTSSDHVDLWILWATVENKMTGTTPENAVQFGDLYDGTENLGAQSYDSGTKAVGKVVPIGTITPAGVHDVVKSGWEFKRDKFRHDFKDGVKDTNRWDSSWSDDTSNPVFQKLTPDASDKIYDRDAPNIADFGDMIISGNGLNGMGPIVRTMPAGTGKPGGKRTQLRKLLTRKWLRVRSIHFLAKTMPTIHRHDAKLREF